MNTEYRTLTKNSPGEIHIVVEKVRVSGNGVILLTGPSSCGKGEIAKALCKFLSLPPERHISMGNLLRMTIDKAKSDHSFRAVLAADYGISEAVSILDTSRNRVEIALKAESHISDLQQFFGRQKALFSQLDWLEFCVAEGLLLPDEWSEKIIEAMFRNTPELREGIFILDGYPRTTAAAEHILNLFSELNIAIIKVLHLSITKQEMKNRALGRKRADDTEDSLERRYQFYVEKVQPCIDYLKHRLDPKSVVLIDAHQPVYHAGGQLDLNASIYAVTLSVTNALGLPEFLLDIPHVKPV